ncbi:MAG TPA: hypothetical protein VIV11_02850 [Kofleriaceae bacterium]
MGTMGNPGSGHNTLVVTTVEPIGGNCGAGGMKFEAGVDTDDNGVLSSSEIDSAQTRYVSVFGAAV